MNIEQNYTLLCDFYELTMGNGYLKNGIGEKTVYFDMFYRRVPDGGGFSINAGLEQVIDYLNNLHFSEEDIAYLESKNIFCKEFIDYLRNFKFICDVYAIPEGTPVFPGEPIITVVGPAIQAQLIETFILLTVNHQTLIATKANRIVRAAQGRPVAEFGSRRAQGAAGAILGARAAYIAGCTSTACTMSDKLYGVPASGTMAHSWIQMFDSELDAFTAYAKLYPDSTLLLVDTYSVIKSGVPNAIKTFDEVLKPMGKRPLGIRIDSGDITYLSKKARKMLDEAGYPDCKIFATNALDEYLIRDLVTQGAAIDNFGVGERLITSRSEPVFGGVYKLAALEDEKGNIIPKIKISENVAKITTPHFKKVYRLYENENGKAIADLLCVYDEEIDDTKPLTIFDPDFTWKQKTLTDYTAKELLVPIFKKGKQVYNKPSLQEIKDYCKEQMDTLWDEVLRFENPHNYYVDLSPKLWNIKQKLIEQSKGV